MKQSMFHLRVFLCTMLAMWLPTVVSAQIIINYPAEIGPWAVAVNPVTNKTYVANHFTGVTVIEGTETTTVATGYGPHAVAVNPVTNKIYVVNDITDDVTVIDGATNIPTQVKDTSPAPGKTASKPYGVAVNTVTNKVYVANFGSDTVTVIDGANGTVSVPAGTNPWAVAVNPITNKIYVTNSGSSNVTVINGADNSVIATIRVGSNPEAVAVNPRTNKVYVANFLSSTVTVIDGASDAVASTVTVGTAPSAVAINPMTNRIYVNANNSGGGSVSVIDGVLDTVATTVPTGNFSQALVVNLVSNIIYVANAASNNVTVIDGATNLTSIIPTGTSPVAVAVNMITNEVYVANKDPLDPNVSSNGTVTVITETPVPPSPLLTSITPLPGNTTGSTTPTFTMTATSSTGSPVRTVYYQVDTVQGSWLPAVSASGSFSGTTPTLTQGVHTLYAFAVDGSDATSINTGSQSSPLIGAIASYTFTVSGVVPPVTYTVTPVNTAHGSISPITPQTVNSGVSIDFLVTPVNGYKIVTVTGCGGTLINPIILTNPTTYRTGPVTANCDVTPTFSTDLLPVRIGSTYYLNLAAAYAKALSGDVIEATEMSFTGDLNLNAGIAVALHGGYDATYAAQTGNTVIVGKLIIGSGSLVVDRLIIQ